MPRITPYLQMLAALAVVTLTVGCSRTVKPDAGFLTETNELERDSRSPFGAFWFKPGTDLRKYTTVYVAPVDSTHLLKMSWWEGFSVEAGRDKDIKVEANKIASYWHDQVVAAFKALPNYTVVDTPNEQTLVLELAIVEVVPTKIWLNAISYAFAGALDTGSTSMEGRIRIGPGGQIVSLFKDTHAGQYSILSVADMQWFSHSRHTADHWANELAELCTSAPDAKISSEFPFTLRPW